MVPLPQTDPSKGDSDEQLLAACRAEESKQRAQFHMDLAAAQWRALAALLSCPPPTAARTLPASTSTPSASVAARVTKSVVSRFVHMHGTVLGSGPFLRGFRLLLETQRGAETTVAWRLKPAVLTQSGGEAWMRDAVGLLLVSAHRRRDCEQGEGAYCPKAQYCDDGG
eukprot:CAMPEP_0181382344 /NCGR_PEP_ID=MMETSP1106-20121128/20683_1 /TAXON_ID=81844 /ORGANISM="Mantoniella antarctica, Strain SL-175" /LENGTH=167 /DNA_ID=CAMNT_0023501745 /DNA_START=99 /DNA_END=599 /DNA_ORIENTATION=-